MHISQTQNLRWPVVENVILSNLSVDFYNKLINFRTDLRNRLITNKMKNGMVYIKNMESDIAEE